MLGLLLVVTVGLSSYRSKQGDEKRPYHGKRRELKWSAAQTLTSQCADTMRMALGRGKVGVTACREAASFGCWPSNGMGPPPCVKNRTGMVRCDIL